MKSEGLYRDAVFTSLSAGGILSAFVMAVLENSHLPGARFPENLVNGLLLAGYLFFPLHLLGYFHRTTWPRWFVHCWFAWTTTFISIHAGLLIAFLVIRVSLLNG
jgi:hypothetical protein